MPSALGTDAKGNLVATLGTLFKELGTAGDAVPPIAFLQVFLFSFCVSLSRIS